MYHKISYRTNTLEENILLKPQVIANDLSSESPQHYCTPLLCLEVLKPVKIPLNSCLQHCSSLIIVVIRKGLTEGDWADAQRALHGTQSCTGRPSLGNCWHLWSNSEKQPPHEWSGDILEQTCSWGASAELHWCQGFVPTEHLIRYMHMHAQFQILLLWKLPNNIKQMKRLLEISTFSFFNTHKEQFLLLKPG